ncbi:MAG TPA: Ig-like domain-containing protein, partial [Gammaproteobacteria bacterium]|nr:Ig-like domain-containing protein [Gammaproteobacteria bacterium]
MIFPKVALVRGLVALAMLYALSACGFVDSGGSQGQPADIAGPDQTVNEQKLVVLRAQNTGGIRSFNWRQVSGQPTVALMNANTANVSFVTPNVTQRAVLVFTLTTMDEFGAADSDRVSITINNGPAANAGGDQRITAGTRVTLNGGKSSDSDGRISTFAWQQTGGAKVFLSGAGTAQPTFTVPPTAQGGEAFTFRLTVTDNDAGRDTDEVRIVVNSPPVARAGQDSTVTAGQSVTLDGSASSDPESRPLAFQWAQIAGPSVTLNRANTATPSFTAPSVTAPAQLRFRLTVTDDVGATESDTVIIRVTPPNAPPVANSNVYLVGEGGTLNIPSPGVLANDTDANGDSLTAILVSGPSHAASFSLQPSGGFSYTHDGSEAASDSFTYRASDGIASSNVTTVTIGIAPINDAPVANNDSYVVDQSGTLNTPSPGVLTNDTDADGDSLVAILLSGPSNAAFFALGPGGAFSYTHNGSATTGDRFTYRVSDGATFSNIATVSINITPVNQPPVANAGVDQVVNAGDAVTLNGSASSDPDGSLTAFQWSQTAGPSVALSDPSSPTPGLIAPGVAAQTILAFNLIVTDDAGARSNAATVTVTVNPLTVSAAGACYTTSSGQLLRGRLDDVMDKQGPL